jgi:HSP20 family protein
MFFAPALRRNAVAAPKQNSSDFGFERFMNETVRSLVPNFHDMEEDEKSWTLTLDVPGVARDQLRVNVVGNTVEVASADDARRHFRAAYELPDGIDADKSQARLQDGVLTLKLAKVESATARRIEVS